MYVFSPLYNFCFSFVWFLVVLALCSRSLLTRVGVPYMYGTGDWTWVSYSSDYFSSNPCVLVFCLPTLQNKKKTQTLLFFFLFPFQLGREELRTAHVFVLLPTLIVSVLRVYVWLFLHTIFWLRDAYILILVYIGWGLYTSAVVLTHSCPQVWNPIECSVVTSSHKEQLCCSCAWHR